MSRMANHPSWATSSAYERKEAAVEAEKEVVNRPTPHRQQDGPFSSETDFPVLWWFYCPEQSAVWVIILKFLAQGSNLVKAHATLSPNRKELQILIVAEMRWECYADIAKCVRAVPEALIRNSTPKKEFYFTLFAENPISEFANIAPADARVVVLQIELPVTLDKEEFKL